MKLQQLNIRVNFQDFKKQMLVVSFFFGNINPEELGKMDIILTSIFVSTGWFKHLEKLLKAVEGVCEK